VNAISKPLVDPDKSTPLTTVFKESGEFKELQNKLEPILTKASNEPRGTAPQYNTHFPWQVIFFISEI